MRQMNKIEKLNAIKSLIADYIIAIAPNELIKNHILSLIMQDDFQTFYSVSIRYPGIFDNFKDYLEYYN